MACGRFREALTDVAAGATPSARAEAHLSACEACRVELGKLRRALAIVDDELSRELAAAPSLELAARIRSGLAEPGRPMRPSNLAWRLVLGAAAAALLVAVAFVARQDSPPPAVATVAPPQPPHAPRAAPPSDPVETPLPARLRSRAGRSEGVGDGPEVLVPAGEAEALLRFATSLQQRAVSPDSLLVANLSAPLPEPKAVFIRPLEIVPLDPGETPGAE